MQLPTFQDIAQDDKELAVYNLPIKGNWLITGPPGSGKTVMALYRAKRLQDAKAPGRLLFTVYNNTLNQYLSDAIAEVGLSGQTSTWHRWFRQLYRTIKGKNPPSEVGRQFDYIWSVVIRELTEPECKPFRVTNVIIDEAQDLNENFFLILPRLASNCTIFADENQQLHEANAQIDKILDYLEASGIQERKLTRNYRNTREIALVAARFYVGLSTGLPDLPLRTGLQPAVISCQSFEQCLESVERYANLHKDESVAVVVKQDSLRHRYHDRLKTKLGSRVQTYSARDGGTLDFNVPKVSVLNTKSVKGLEFDATYLDLQYPGAELSVVDRMELYVATSRARTSLNFLHYGPRPSWMNQYLSDVVIFRDFQAAGSSRIF